MQCENGRRACNQPHRGAGKWEVRRQGAGDFDGGLNSRGYETGAKRVIETMERQTDRAFLAVGMVLDIGLVQHQAELADDQRNDEQQPAEPVRPVTVRCKSVDHDPEGYTPSCVNGNRFPVSWIHCRDPCSWLARMTGRVRTYSPGIRKRGDCCGLLIRHRAFDAAGGIPLP